MRICTSWRRWREHFEHNRLRPEPPAPVAAALAAHAVAPLAWSLARFQLGETGEGRIARDIYRVRLVGIDDDYRRALGLFIKEEGRHARILAGLVRALGGRLVTATWTRTLFVAGRRLLGAGAAGIRFKLLVLLAAEVVGIGFYSALARALPRGPLSAALEQIRDDEAAHLRFHRDFFAVAAPRGWRRALFRVGLAAVGTLSALAVLWDHRRTLRALGIPVGRTARELAALLRAAAARDAGAVAAPGRTAVAA